MSYSCLGYRPQAAPRVEHIVNGGFETGAFPPWSPTGDVAVSSADPRTGTYNCRYRTVGTEITMHFSPSILSDDLINGGSGGFWVKTTGTLSISDISWQVIFPEGIGNAGFDDFVRFNTYSQFFDFTDQSIPSPIPTGVHITDLNIVGNPYNSDFVDIDDVSLVTQRYRVQPRIMS